MTLEHTINQTIFEASLNKEPDDYTMPVYCLGPGQTRINFYSQQMRSFNLVWSLNQKDLFKKTDKIAVVGAGISGVACAAAFASYGCQVDIYDDSHEPLTRQVAAQHREVYPDLNFWPEKLILSATTDNPIFDWSFDECSTVIRSLRSEWHDIVGKSNGYIKHYPSRVNSFVVVDETEGRKSVRLKHGRGNSSASDYRLVILACGFKPEANIVAPNQKSAPEYWEPDNYEYVLNQLDSKISDFLICGAGDGGQIDALRLVYDMRKGRLAFDLAKSLEGSELALELHEIWKTKKGELLEERTYKKYAGWIKTKKEYQNAKRLLTLLDYQRSGKTIHIASKTKTPYSKQAAPIHKLMMKYAEMNKEIRVYSDSKVEYDASSKKYKVGDSIELEEQNTLVIVRSGAANAFHDLLSQEEIKIVNSKQKFSGKHKVEAIWPEGEFITPKGVPCKIQQRPEYITSKYAESQKVLTSLGFTGFLLVPTSTHFAVHCSNPSGLPDTLFGIPLIHVSDPHLINRSDTSETTGEDTFDAA